MISILDFVYRIVTSMHNISYNYDLSKYFHEEAIPTGMSKKVGCLPANVTDMDCYVNTDMLNEC